MLLAVFGLVVVGGGSRAGAGAFYRWEERGCARSISG